MLSRISCRCVRLMESPLNRCIIPSSYTSSSPLCLESSRTLHLSSIVFKVKAKGSKDKLKTISSNVRSAEISDNEFMKEALKEMKELEGKLISHLASQTSLQVDLRPYENVIVKLDDKTEERLGKLARISLKGARTVVMNVTERPSTIKAIKLALQKSPLTSCVNVQQEGVVLYVSTPLMTRERREELAEEASTTLLNDYKKNVNEVYIRIEKKATGSTKSVDEQKRTRNNLLVLKRTMEDSGLHIVKEAKKKLLAEVV